MLFILLVIVFCVATPPHAFAQRDDLFPNRTTQPAQSSAPAELRKNPMRDTRQLTKERIQELRAGFRQKLASIRDERKKATIERIDTNLTQVNQRVVAKMESVLDKLTRILTSVKEKAATAKQNGTNTQELDEAIVVAETALASASAAVSEQKAKEYVIPLESETTARAVVGEAVKQFREELSIVHKLVVDARQAVWQAVQALRGVTHTENKLHENN